MCGKLSNPSAHQKACTDGYLFRFNPKKNILSVIIDNRHETHDFNFTDIFDFTWILIKNIVIRTCSHENIPTQKIPDGNVLFLFG